MSQQIMDSLRVMNNTRLLEPERTSAAQGTQGGWSFNPITGWSQNKPAVKAPPPPPVNIPQRELKFNSMPQAGWTPPNSGFNSILNPTPPAAGTGTPPPQPMPPRPMPSPTRPQQSFMPQAQATMSSILAQQKAGGM
jgi:hypothetical protein